jgi:hypothetical protein
MQERPVQPFFHFRINWLVIGLPLSAVIASFITLAIAISNPDPVLQPKAAAPQQRPAVEGRNHAATGGKPVAPREGLQNP